MVRDTSRTSLFDRDSTIALSDAGFFTARIAEGGEYPVSKLLYWGLCTIALMPWLIAAEGLASLIGETGGILLVVGLYGLALGLVACLMDLYSQLSLLRTGRSHRGTFTSIDLWTWWGLLFCAEAVLSLPLALLIAGFLAPFVGTFAPLLLVLPFFIQGWICIAIGTLRQERRRLKVTAQGTASA